MRLERAFAALGGGAGTSSVDASARPAAAQSAMNARPLASLVAVVSGGCATVALAQGELVTYSWRFVEVVEGTNTPVASPNGMLQPGEAARLTLDVSFTPPVGSTVTYNPPPPPGVGTVAGLSEVFFNLLGDTSAQGTWSFHQRAPGFSIGMQGTELPGGTGRENASAAQFVLPGQTANALNPIPALWSMVWTPASYSPRSVTWQSAPGSSAPTTHSSLLIQYGTTAQGEPQYVGKFVAGQFGSVAVPIVPAPGVGVVALGGAAWLTRRRRVAGQRPARSRASGSQTTAWRDTVPA